MCGHSKIKDTINQFFTLNSGKCFEENTYYDGPHVDVLQNIKNATDCQERCQYKISGCNYFSYEKGTEKCELKRRKNKSVTRESVTSGPKYCPNDYAAAKTSEFLPRNGAEWEDGPCLIAEELDTTYLNGLVSGCGVKISNTELVLIGGHGIDGTKNPYKKVTKFNVMGQLA